jgi:hypothetical protein
VSGRWGSDYVFEYEPFYIGEGTGYRKFAHFTCSRNPEKSAKIKAIKEFGFEPLIIVVEDGLSKVESRELEAKLIFQLGTLRDVRGIHRGPLTNRNAGGGGVEQHSDETRLRMRSARLGKKHLPSTIEKMKATKALGCSIEKIEKLSSARKGGKWMFRGNERRFVKGDDISKLLADGFTIGMNKSRKKTITDL